MKDLDAILVDHAHCEMKAAMNALSLVVRHPDDLAVVRALTELAREELDHFRRVVAFLERKNLVLGPPPVDQYAAELRSAMSRLPHSELPPITDRLIVSALIEARSCERFKLLLESFPRHAPHDLKVFYEELFACEARHYRAYVDLAQRSARTKDGGNNDAEVQKRLELLAESEATIVKSLAERDRRATVHG